MQLLDATLAFALTMAALATVVTIIMEVCLRVARMRKKNLIQVMKLLNDELGNGSLGMSDDERWAFFTRVVDNPAEAAKEVSKIEWQHKTLEERISSYGKDKKWKGLYDKVSLEYLLRCLAECECVQKASRQASDKIKVEFNRLARKYEEFGSAVSASFKRYAQFWSIAIGVALAIAANIDGVRIFESYRTDPQLAAAVIEKQETFLENYQKAQESLKDFKAVQEKVTELESQLAIAQKEQEGAGSKDAKEKVQARVAELEKTLKGEKALLDEKLALKNIQSKARQAQQQLTDLAAMGVPLGWDFYPNCPYGQGQEAWATSSPKCQALAKTEGKKIRPEESSFGGRIFNTALNGFGGFLIWLFSVTMTGILIGLGAPFWFDVAKRLAQIRKGLQKPSSSAEYRLSGSDANGNPEKRKEIVASVLVDAASEAAASVVAETGLFLGPKALRL